MLVAEPELDGMAEAIDELDGMADDDFADGDDAADVPELPELQAATPMTSPAAVTEIPRMRRFTISPLY
jgi:hypothetical protein